VKKSFLQDVLDQPASLREAINNFPVTEVVRIKERIESGELRKIILTGHGSSYNSLYPAFLKLSSNPTPVMLWQTAELVHYGLQQIDSETLLCVNSQSGRSAEVVHLIEKTSRARPGMLLAFTNEPQSTLGSQSDIIINLLAGEEHGVATKTYMNALCLSSLLALQLSGENIEDGRKMMLAACDEMEAYLASWEDRVKEIDTIFGKMSHVMVIGRGPSMASAQNAALNQKEAAWLFSEGMNAAEFRHGPLELVDENMTLIVMEGDHVTSKFNSMLAEEVQQYGGDVLWIGNQPPTGIKNFHFPEVDDIARPVVELLPLQLLAYQLANRKNMEAGKFRHIGKVVLKE
jgi:glucosamine--fructose-6-phosphate aminotransferase (isomerizing)